jgi:DNA polymerase III delta subunit
MKLSPVQIIQSDAPALYLFGEDGDSLFEAAELLLEQGDPGAVRLRVDVSELARVETESRSQGLFGPSKCYALIRNAESANPKQSDHLLKMVAEARSENRLVICAPGIDWKKALHKKMQAMPQLAQCEFHTPTPAAFQQWLESAVTSNRLDVSDEALQMIGERLHGMRAAARQLIERLRLYDNGRGEKLDMEVVGDLLGERCPQDLEAYCHAVAARDVQALPILRRMLHEQQVAEVQVISWLGTRMNQLLSYLWYQTQRESNPAQKARLFGEARKQVPNEAKLWKGKELSYAVKRISEAEKLIKGASVESNLVVLERMTMDLLKGEASA